MQNHKEESRKRRLAWAVLAMLSIAALGWSVWSGIQRREFVDCNAKQTSLIIRYLAETRSAAAEERVATDKVRLAQLEGDMPGARKAIEEYFVARKAADKRRAAAALPPLPETVCGQDRT